MLRGNWLKHPKTGLIGGLVVAVVFCAVWIGYGLLQSANYERQASANSAEYSRYTRDKVAQTCARLTGAQAVDCLYNAQDAQAEYSYNQADLVAQRQSALWGYIMAAAAIIGMGLSVIGVWLVWTTFRETRKANQISRDASRAWVSLTVGPAGKFWLSAEKLDFRFNVILENHGDSPAIKAFCKAFIILGDPRNFASPDLSKVIPTESTDCECVVFPNSSPLGTEIITELTGGFPERAEINLMVVCRYQITGHNAWRGSTRTFQLRPNVELYEVSGRFRMGVCELRVPENHAEQMRLHMKERNDCPPTAT